MSDSWNEREKVKENQYFRKLNEAALKKIRGEETAVEEGTTTLIDGIEVQRNEDGSLVVTKEQLDELVEARSSSRKTVSWKDRFRMPLA